VEFEFLSDAFYCIQAKFKTFFYGWPATLDMVAELQAVMMKNIGIDDLRSYGCFGRIKNANAFLRHYGKFDALLPKEIRPASHISLVDDVETRIALMIGAAPSTKTARRTFATTTAARDSTGGEFPVI